jgi:hypothetical protein
VGSVDLLKSALLHPIPSSRRHVIRVDMPVLVDVIRFAFWMDRFMKRYSELREMSIWHAERAAKFKIMMAVIDISAQSHASDFFICVANWRSRETNAVDATDSVRSRR